MSGRFDPHGAEALIDYFHHLSHQGKLYQASDYETGAGPFNYLLITGPKVFHAKLRISISTGGNVTITENLSAGTAGTNLPFTNYNRVMAVVNPGLLLPGVTLSKSPTGLAGGVAFPPDYIPVNAINYPQVGINTGAEWLFLPNTKYSIVATLLASGNLNWDIEGYEENYDTKG
jgi:hypothetical protein